LKQLIVLFSTIILGLSIFALIMTDNGNSVYSSVKALWQNQVEVQTVYP